MSMARSRITIIAEAGVNHDGDLDTALELVDVAADAGADVVKFQSFHADRLTTAGAQKAEYQRRNTGSSESQREMLVRLELSEEEQFAIAAHCVQRGIEFMSSPFDISSLEFLVERCRVRRIKLGSGELTNAPLLLAAARSGLPVVLSTGMADMEEVRTAVLLFSWGISETAAPPALDALPEAAHAALDKLANRLVLLHCVSEYPAPVGAANLRAVISLREAFGVEVGYSDHCTGINVCLAAAAVGARYIEKHFTLSRTRKGPDHLASLEPSELVALVNGIREVEDSLGDGKKRPTAGETETRTIARRSVVAARPIREGEAFTAENLAVKRPAGGISAIHFFEILGRRAPRDFASDEPVVP